VRFEIGDRIRIQMLTNNIDRSGRSRFTGGVATKAIDHQEDAARIIQPHAILVDGPLQSGVGR
jgi:hypothetical protein